MTMASKFKTLRAQGLGLRAPDVARRAQGLGLRAVGAAAVVAALSAQPLALEKLLALCPQPLALAESLALAEPSALFQPRPSSPIIVKIVEPKAKSDLEGLSDVLLGSLGLTGLITLAALLLGAGLACVMFWVRSRSE
jgi:hypothetical protein